MPLLTPDKLMSLETYARRRKEFRAQVMEHKKKRTVQIGEHISLLFEDELTIRYQVQEMLRIERIFDEPGIQSELDAYNPLIPDGTNFKATMLIQYEDIEVRHRMLRALKGVEHRVWVEVERCERVFAIADEDLERANDEKTSATHFLRFVVSAEMNAALVSRGADLTFGVDHNDYSAHTRVSKDTRQALIADLRPSTR